MDRLHSTPRGPLLDEVPTLSLDEARGLWDALVRKSGLEQSENQALLTGYAGEPSLASAIEAAIRAGRRLSEAVNTHNERASIHSAIEASVVLNEAFQRVQR
ncbi:MAG: hypothetical protein VX529_11940 [Pseudomonadota bacterium]|nr:hypothetical protein [Pseudomonadota bacterium]